MSARAIVSGFVATVALVITFILAYGLAVVLSGVELVQRRGAEGFRDYFYGLTHNQLIDSAYDNLYFALALHLAAGLVWALIYAYVAEPRLSGPGWFRGIVFSFVPWILSLVVFLPIVGGGFFGSQLNAGPLPIIGNLILHLVYGASLGLLYSPFGDRLVDSMTESDFTPEEAERSLRQSEALQARGILAGLVVGIVIGVVGAVIAASAGPETEVLGVSPLAFATASTLIGAAFGGLIGSLAGLTPAQPPIEKV